MKKIILIISAFYSFQALAFIEGSYLCRSSVGGEDSSMFDLQISSEEIMMSSIVYGGDETSVTEKYNYSYPLRAKGSDSKQAPQRMNAEERKSGAWSKMAGARRESPETIKLFSRTLYQHDQLHAFYVVINKEGESRLGVKIDFQSSLYDGLRSNYWHCEKTSSNLLF